MKNQELSRLFSRIADALEIKGETGFRVLAYRRAARVLADLTDDVAVLDQTGSLEQVPGIGPGIARKIREFLATGRMKKYDESVAGLPPGLFDLLDLQGIGPKTVKLLYEQLGVSDRQMLQAAVESGKFAALPGMGEKKAANVIQALRAGRTTGERMYLDEAFELAESVVEHLLSAPGVRQVSYGGSLRRGCETIGDIDILATGTKPERIIEHFLAHPSMRQQLGAGQTRASARFEIRGRERQVDLRVVRDHLYGAALQYFTGSKEHNVAVRALAQKNGLKLSEYGLFRGSRRIAGRTETEVYQTLGLPYIEPELRENRGELEAAARGELPELVTTADMKSDLHIHTNLSDGTATFDELVAAARNRGYTHVAFADHSVSAHYAGGRSAEQLLRHCDAVDEFNRRSPRFKVLKSSEVDITPDGRLDFPDVVLARLDFVIASVHQAFKKDVTHRVCDALAHPLVHCIGHPSGRLIGQRPGYDIDLEKVIETAAKHRKILEINSFYARLDLSDVWARKAGEAGVKVAINTDAHAVNDLDWMRFGLLVARRAWLEKKDVVNTMSFSQLLRFLSTIRNQTTG